MSGIVIIGFGSAGFAALMAVRRNAPKAAVTVIDPKPYDLTHPCGIPYALAGRLDAGMLCQDVALGTMGVRKVRARATRLDSSRGVVLTDGDEAEIPFDCAIIATGFTPFIPPIPGARELLGKGLFTLSSIDDLGAISAAAPGSGPCLVIGAGAIGLEAAVAMKRFRGGVTVVEAQGQLLPGVLDPDMSSILEKRLASGGITIRLGSSVESLSGSGALTGAVAGGEALTCDICVLAAGFRPNTALAAQSGIALGEYGVAVDASMKTSMPGVYAAGDCVSGWSVLDGRPVSAKLATSAYRQGTVAGINAAGGQADYRGSAMTFVSEIGGLEVAGTGHTTEAAARCGFEPVAGRIASTVLPDYFPGGTEVTVKVIADRKTGRIIGGQAIGERGAAERVNILSAAIEFAIPAPELSRLEMAYCPAVSEVYDPLLRAVDFAIRRLKR